MIRKLLLPAACATLLGGCVTGYGYNDGYYYGRPSSSVRYYGGASYGYPYGYDYGYGPYGYGYPYGYYGYGGGYPYYYYRHHYCGDGHHHDCDRDHDDDDDDQHAGGGDRPPWRRWADDRGDMLKRRVPPNEARPTVRMATPSQPRAAVERPSPTSVPRVSTPRPVERRSAPRMSAPERPRNRQERDLRREQER